MTITDEIRFVLEAKAAALVARDATTLDGLIHGHFIYVNAGGRRFDRAGYLDTYCTSGRVIFTQQRFADIAVTLIDGVAVATLSIDDELRIGDRAVSGRYASLCVFGQSSGQWRWAAGQTMSVGSP